MSRKLTNAQAIERFSSAGLELLEDYQTALVLHDVKCKKCSALLKRKISDLHNGGGTCPFCSGMRATEDSAEKTFEMALLQPLVDFPGKSKGWKSKCLKCGEIVSPSLAYVQKTNKGCAYCSGRKVRKSELNQVLILNKVNPLEPYPGALVKWKMECQECNSIVYPKWNSIKSGQGACIYCAGQGPVDPTFAVELMEKNGLIPLEDFPGNQVRWRCECKKCGREVFPNYNNIHQGHAGCLFCAEMKVDPGFANQLFLENFLKPLEPFVSGRHKWHCECMKCGKEVFPTYHSVRATGGGCKYCSNFGIDFNAPGYLYLITNFELGAHKIGIGGSAAKRDRIEHHSEFGWSVFKRKDFLVADAALEVEQRVLEWLRVEMGLQAYLSKELLPQGGWTETVDADEIDLTKIWEKVEEFSK